MLSKTLSHRVTDTSSIKRRRGGGRGQQEHLNPSLVQKQNSRKTITEDGTHTFFCCPTLSPFLPPSFPPSLTLFLCQNSSYLQSRTGARTHHAQGAAALFPFPFSPFPITLLLPTHTYTHTHTDTKPDFVLIPFQNPKEQVRQVNDHRPSFTPSSPPLPSSPCRIPHHPLFLLRRSFSFLPHFYVYMSPFSLPPSLPPQTQTQFRTVKEVLSGASLCCCCCWLIISPLALLV